MAPRRCNGFWCCARRARRGATTARRRSRRSPVPPRPPRSPSSPLSPPFAPTATADTGLSFLERMQLELPHVQLEAFRLQEDLARRRVDVEGVIDLCAVDEDGDLLALAQAFD